MLWPRHSAEVRELLRRYYRLFLPMSLAAIALRLYFVTRYPLIEGDSFIYGDIAKNWLLHGVYGLTANVTIVPTLIRLPGYPMFLALCFKVLGVEHYHAVLYVQVVVDLASCWVISALALEIMRPPKDEKASLGKKQVRVALAAMLLAAVCPFTANYTATVLTESGANFLSVFSLYCAVRGFRALQEDGRLLWWLGCGLALGLDIMFRPDGGLLAAVLGIALGIFWLRSESKRRTFCAGLLLAGAVLLFMVPWSVRNWRVMHAFQPLAPRYATDPGEFVPHGFNLWVKTWMVDYISVVQVYWPMGGQPLDSAQLPSRAIDNAVELQKTQQLFDAYNESLTLSPELDAQFAALARQRIQRHPLRYYLWLPALRIADMWFRPRTEMLPIELDWWNVDDHTEESVIAISMAAVNLLFVLLALWGIRVGLAYGNRQAVWLMVAFLLSRTILLGTLENPEPRYTLECYPMILVLAAVTLAVRRKIPLAASG